MAGAVTGDKAPAGSGWDSSGFGYKWEGGLCQVGGVGGWGVLLEEGGWWLRAEDPGLAPPAPRAGWAAGFGEASGACGSWDRLAFPPRKFQQERQAGPGRGWRGRGVAAVVGAGGRSELLRRKTSGHWCQGRRGNGRSGWPEWLAAQLVAPRGGQRARQAGRLGRAPAAPVRVSRLGEGVSSFWLGSSA